MLPNKCLTRGQSWLLALKTPPNFIFCAAAGASSLRGFGCSTMGMETGKPLKEDCLTNKEVLGDAFIGRRELNLKKILSIETSWDAGLRYVILGSIGKKTIWDLKLLAVFLIEKPIAEVVRRKFLTFHTEHAANVLHCSEQGLSILTSLVIIAVEW